ncbi:MAG: bactofilin family protein [Bacillota bacterium]|jgi:cytoskeletal protein CcmA (bactofilin family)
MFRRDRQLSSGDRKVDTYIGKGARVQGTVSVSGTVRVDGFVDGVVEAEKDVIVGEGGLVTASITAANVTVAGELRGNVKASGRLEIARTGKVLGDVAMASFVVEEGAVFLGKCEMLKTDAHRPSAQLEPVENEAPGASD